MHAAILWVHENSVLLASWGGALCVVGMLVVFVSRLARSPSQDD